MRTIEHFSFLCSELRVEWNPDLSGARADSHGSMYHEGRSIRHGKKRNALAMLCATLAIVMSSDNTALGSLAAPEPPVGTLITLEVIPHRPGPYLRGETVGFDVMLVSQRDELLQLRFVRLDFGSSSDHLQIAEPIFDFSSLSDMSLYSVVSDFPRYWATYENGDPLSGFILELDPEQSMRLATVDVRVPDLIGSFKFDVLHPTTINSAGGAKIESGFPTATNFWVGDATLTGESLSLRVIPEPASLLLLAVGALSIAFRRRL